MPRPPSAVGRAAPAGVRGRRGDRRRRRSRAGCATVIAAGGRGRRSRPPDRTALPAGGRRPAASERRARCARNSARRWRRRVRAAPAGGLSGARRARALSPPPVAAIARRRGRGGAAVLAAHRAHLRRADRPRMSCRTISRPTAAICLSAAVAQPCRALVWRAIHLAARPTPARSWRRLKRPGEDARPSPAPRTRQRSHRHPSSARHVHGAQQGGKARWPAQVALRQRTAARSILQRQSESRTEAGSQARLAAKPRVCGRRRPEVPAGPLLDAPGSVRHAAASSDAEAGAAGSPPSGRPLTGASPIGGAAQRPSGAGAGCPGRRATQSRATGCGRGAEDVARLAGRARGRHRRRRRRGACAQLLGTLSGQRAAGQPARPGSRRGADAGRRRGAKRRRRATDLAAGRAGAWLGRRGRRAGQGRRSRRSKPPMPPCRSAWTRSSRVRPGRRCGSWRPGSISWRLRLRLAAAAAARARR